MQVAGYVKSAGPPGVFVCLARNLDARIRWGCGLQVGCCAALSCPRSFAQGRDRDGHFTAVRTPDLPAQQPVVLGVCATLSPPSTSGCSLCRLNQLADGFVEKPAEAFPEGRLVVGQVLKAGGSK